MLDKAKFECIHGNSFVQSQVKSEHPDIHAALMGVAKAVDAYRGPRNELIHSSAFSSRELGLFQSIRLFRIDTVDIDTDDLARQHYVKGGMEIALTIGRLAEVLTTLLDFLAPLFIIAAHTTTPSQKNSAPEGDDQA